ncbi:MAG TPA: choice-of-anchor tandem repeat GloVer-containing protein [Rhizomicrobium sp.]|nr:choice-of-anchor tandem repeat GloVer-containing protein [Rhizomicrobium sp.]
MRNNIYALRAGLLGCGLALALAGDAQAGKFTVLHSFVGGSSDGASPLGGLAPAGNGGFYIATDGGGSSNRGTLTLLRKDGTTQVLHAFTGGTDGQNADGTPLVWPSDDRNVYGTTQFGGASGCGTFYKYIPGSDTYQQIYAPECAPEGAFPFAGLVWDRAKDVLMGTGYNGGSNDDGTLFAFDTVGNFGTECPNSFSGSNGSHPYAGMSFAYGNGYTVTTSGGQSSLGTILEFPYGNESCIVTVLHAFAGGAGDGAIPYGRLLYNKHMLYGTTSKGGAPGLGVVFKINLDGSNFAVLHTFQGINQNSDGSFPHAGLTLNKADGMLYGTTINGGNGSDLGTVFKIDPETGVETVVHAFSGSDGAHPYGDLYINKGNIYGTTAAGGASNLGVVFRLKT